MKQVAKAVGEANVAEVTEVAEVADVARAARAAARLLATVPANVGLRLTSRCHCARGP